MKFVATIEARMGSSRLPGKVLLPVLGRPLLQYLLERLRAVPSIDDIVLATTVAGADDALADFARAMQVRCFRGSEDDVMDRVIRAAASAGADVVVEITGDCPLIDPQIVEQVVRMFKAHHAEYVSNAHVRSYPIGMDVQVFPLDALRRSASMTGERLDREHVTLHMRSHPEWFPAVHLVAPPELHWPELGLTLDEAADFDLLSRVIERLYPHNPMFGCRDMVDLLRRAPELASLNTAVARKGDR